MAWSDIRRRAREVVHNNFAEFDARYYAKAGVGPGVRVSVRVHTRILTQGDAERRGYAERYEEIEKVIMLTDDYKTLGVKKGGAVKMPDGRTYILQAMHSPRDDFTVEYDVTRLL